MKKTTDKLALKPVSAFSRLHTRKREHIQASAEVSKTLMALSAEDHRAIAKLIKAWMAN